MQTIKLYFLNGLMILLTQGVLQYEVGFSESQSATNPVVTSSPAQHQRIFGTYRIHLGAERPTYSQLKYYEKLYGDSKVGLAGESRIYPNFEVDIFAWDWYATLGARVGLSYYKANGFAASGIKDKDDLPPEDQVERDLKGPTELTIIPLQAGIVAEMSPSRLKWVVFSGWAGYEQAFFQEVRVNSSNDTASAAKTSKPFINKGWKGASFVGGGVSFILNPLEEEPVLTMNRTMGFGFVYLTPYIEIVQASQAKGANFSRTIYGLNFSYETIR